LPVRIRLRAETTKSNRADTLAVHPQLEAELRTIRPSDNTGNAPILLHVPGMAALRADLKLAGIDSGSRLSGFVDFHSLRKSLSTMMAAAGMSQRARQAHMRHTDPRLTESTYIDERLLPIATELSKLPAIPGVNDAAPQPLPMPAANAPNGQSKTA
jgi:integrase